MALIERLTRLARLLRPGARSAGAASPRGFLASPTAPTSGPVPTYAPERDGEPDPGEIVWAWVPYEDDPSQGKDRPVLVLAEEQGGWVGLMLTSKDHDGESQSPDRHGRHWMDVGSGAWDSRRRPSEVRLDRRLHLTREGFRREGAALDPAVFDAVVAAVRGLPR